MSSSAEIHTQIPPAPRRTLTLHCPVSGVETRGKNPEFFLGTGCCSLSIHSFIHPTAIYLDSVTLAPKFSEVNNKDMALVTEQEEGQDIKSLLI